jgi:hypothetical protein
MQAPSWKEDPKAWQRWYRQQPHAKEAKRIANAKYQKTRFRRHDFGSRSIHYKPLAAAISNWRTQ